jgi:hypothetical protein
MLDLELLDERLSPRIAALLVYSYGSQAGIYGRTVVLCISQAELSNAPGLEKWGLTAKVEKQTPSETTF